MYAQLQESCHIVMQLASNQKDAEVSDLPQKPFQRLMKVAHTVHTYSGDCGEGKKEHSFFLVSVSVLYREFDNCSVHMMIHMLSFS